ncbi:MAG: hypothetical protein KAF91_17725 [Nostoc sp. TH1S01]|nr:hypothetical protein [Nostoc sp. TH1S01]
MNEISKPVIDSFIAQNKLPNFAKLNQEWVFYKTVSEEQTENCEPWIQWVTAHTGKALAEHKIFRLGDAQHLNYIQIFEKLSEHGIQSAIVGSMNVARRNTKGGLFFPDPWSSGKDCFPREIKPLWELISKAVQKHDASRLELIELVRAMRVCIDIKIPVSIYTKIFYQLIYQKIDPLIKWKLVGLFDCFLAEFFKRILASTDFGFYTLFLNCVAHYQHHYWRNHDQTGFDPTIKYTDCHEFDNPLEYGYQLYDSILGEILNLSNRSDTLMIIASGLSQTPFQEKEFQGGMNYYRLRKHEQFVQRIGIHNMKIYPLMSRDWKMSSNSPAEMENAAKIINGLTVAGETLFKSTQNQPNCLFIETSVEKYIPNDTDILDCDGKTIAKFGDAFMNIAIKSGYHTGIGYLWISEKPSSKKHLSQYIQLANLYDLPIQALIPNHNRCVNESKIALSAPNLS